MLFKSDGVTNEGDKKKKNMRAERLGVSGSKERNRRLHSKLQLQVGELRFKLKKFCKTEKKRPRGRARTMTAPAAQTPTGSPCCRCRERRTRFSCQPARVPTAASVRARHTVHRSQTESNRVKRSQTESNTVKHSQAESNTDTHIHTDA